MDTSAGVKSVNPEELFLSILPSKTRHAFLSCTKLDLFKGSKWYLAGGTALALQEGHRQSVDLDFFTKEGEIKEKEIERRLFITGKWQTGYLDRGTIYGTLENAKMSLIAYPFFIPSNQKLKCGYVRILPSHDIAAMKIIAISQRGKKRDFVDLYWYCKKHEGLYTVISRSIKQYPGQEKIWPTF